MSEIHLKVLYHDLTNEQLEGIRAISKDSVRRNGIDAWFEPLDGITDEQIASVCQEFDLVRIQ